MGDDRDNNILIIRTDPSFHLSRISQKNGSWGNIGVACLDDLEAFTPSSDAGDRLAIDMMTYLTAYLRTKLVGV